jgi:cytoskeletal protein CcmA (bactofilin family)
MTARITAMLVLAGLLAAAAPSTPTDDIVRSGGTLSIAARGADDVILSGRAVGIGGRVDDTLIAAGRSIVSRAAVGGDTVLAGRRVRAMGEVGDNLFAAGADVDVSGTVKGDVYAAGGTVRLAEDSTVDGDIAIGAGEAVIAATIGRDARLAGGDIRLTGNVGGNVDVTAERVSVGPVARIDGRLVVRSAQPPEIASTARIDGGVQHIATPRAADRRGWRERGLAAIPTAIGIWVIGAVLLLIVPGIAAAASTELARRPLATFLIGLAIALLSLPVIVLLAVTLVGLPFALGALGAWLFAIAAAVPVFALAVALRYAGRRDGSRQPRGRAVLAPLAVIAAVLAIVNVPPVIGPIILGVLAVFGIGTVGQAWLTTRRRWREATA